MKIKKATLEDLDALAKLFDAYRVFYEKKSDLVGAKNFLQARIERQESTIFIYTDAHDVQLGFVQLYPIFSSTRMQRMWLLNDLFVTPKARGRGISLVLIEAAKELCQETQACGLLLETAKTNTIGNHLYPKTGFSLNQDYNYYTWDCE